MSKLEIRVLENARKLENLEKDFLKFTYETSKPKTKEALSGFFEEAIRLAAAAFAARNEILEDFKDVTELTIIDKRVLRTLDAIRHDDKFYSIAFHENIAEMLNANAENDADRISLSIHDVLHDKFDDLFSEFHSWFDIIGYYFDKIKVGPIISSLKVPAHLLSYFDELKESYAFGQYKASTALCRTLLEIAMYDKLKAKGAFKNKDSKVTSIDVTKEDNLCRYINMAKCEKMLSKNSTDTAHEIRRAANEVLHAKEAGKKLDRKFVIDTIFSTVKIVEELYSDNIVRAISQSANHRVVR
jgi:hypothetical protein